MKLQCVALVLLLLASGACGPKSSDLAPVDRIKITQGGVIYLNGKPTSLEALREDFAELKAKKGRVSYYRDNPQGEPTEQAMRVLQAIVEAKLPVRLCKTEAELDE